MNSASRAEPASVSSKCGSNAASNTSSSGLSSSTSKTAGFCFFFPVAIGNFIARNNREHSRELANRINRSGREVSFLVLVHFLPRKRGRLARDKLENGPNPARPAEVGGPFELRE